MLNTYNMDVSGIVVDSTSVYTPNGWKEIDKIDSRTKIAQLDINTGLISFANPIRYVVKSNVYVKKTNFFIGSGKVFSVSNDYNIFFYDLSENNKKCILPAYKLGSLGSKYIPIYSSIDIEKEKKRFNRPEGFNFYSFLEENYSLVRVSMGNICTYYSDSSTETVVKIVIPSGFFLIKSKEYTILVPDSNAVL